LSNDDETKRPRRESGAWLSLIAGIIYEVISRPKTEAPPEDRRAREDRSHRHTVWATWTMAAFTAAIFGVGVFQYLVTKGQLDVLRRQLNDSEIQEAASITLRNFSIGGFPDQPSLNVDVVNTGRTRADQVTVDGGEYWVQGHDVMALLNQVGQFSGRAIPSELGFSIEPSEPARHLVIGLQPLPPPGFPAKAKLPTRDEFASGDVTTLIYAIGVYRDVFGKTHRVVDCGAHYPASNGNFISCFAGNRHFDDQK
jgi:hypothetical protein